MPDYAGLGLPLLVDVAGPSDPLQIALGPGTDNVNGGIPSLPFGGVTAIQIPFAISGQGLVTATAYLGGKLVGSVSDPGSTWPGFPFSVGGLAIGFGARPMLFDRIVLTSTAPGLGIGNISDVRVRVLPEPATLTLAATGALALALAAVGRRRRG